MDTSFFVKIKVKCFLEIGLSTFGIFGFTLRRSSG